MKEERIGDQNLNSTMMTVTLQYSLSLYVHQI